MAPFFLAGDSQTLKAVCTPLTGLWHAHVQRICDFLYKKWFSRGFLSSVRNAERALFISEGVFSIPLIKTRFGVCEWIHDSSRWMTERCVANPRGYVVVSNWCGGLLKRHFRAPPLLYIVSDCKTKPLRVERGRLGCGGQDTPLVST